jgi:hypothetical protein
VNEVHEWYVPEICHPYEDWEPGEPRIQLRYSPPNKHGQDEDDSLGFNKISFLTVRVVLCEGLLDEFGAVLADEELYIETSIPLSGPGAFGITITRKVKIISW